MTSFQLLDPATVRFYRDRCDQHISQLTEKLTQELSEEDTRKYRAQLKCYREVAKWKPEPLSTDTGVNFL